MGRHRLTLEPRVLCGWWSALSQPSAGCTLPIHLQSAFCLPGAAHVSAEDRAKIQIQQRLFKVRLIKLCQELSFLMFNQGREKWGRWLSVWIADFLWIFLLLVVLFFSPPWIARYWPKKVYNLSNFLCQDLYFSLLTGCKVCLKIRHNTMLSVARTILEYRYLSRTGRESPGHCAIPDFRNSIWSKELCVSGHCIFPVPFLLTHSPWQNAGSQKRGRKQASGPRQCGHWCVTQYKIMILVPCRGWGCF